MADVYIYDPAHDNDRVLNYLPSVSGSPYLPRVGVDVVIYGKGSTFPTLTEPQAYWRHDAGEIRDMDAGEKAARDAEIAAQWLANKRAGAQAIMLADGPQGASKRAIAEMTIREINILREWDRDFQAAVAAATSFADLQARIAALPSLADRTLAQAKAAYDSICSEGTAD